MKFCPNCGAQAPQEANNCPNCGTAFNNTNAAPEAQPTQPTQPTGNYTGPKAFQKRDIVKCIILSIVTCGIYGIIWFVNMVNDVNACCNDGETKSGGMVFLLTLVTFGIYGFIWVYNAGKRLNTAGTKYGKTIQDNSILYLILMIFGLGIVTYALIQDSLNKMAE